MGFIKALTVHWRRLRNGKWFSPELGETRSKKPVVKGTFERITVPRSRKEVIAMAKKKGKKKKMKKGMRY